MSPGSLCSWLVGKYVPVRFLAFAGVGMLGIGVHFIVLSIVFKSLNVRFAVGQAVATAVAIPTSRSTTY
jgi:dolichol-phosphate mannosyltransferase